MKKNKKNQENSNNGKGKPLLIVLVFLLVIVWFSIITGALGAANAKNQMLEAAKQSVADGLYEQATLQYKEVMASGETRELYNSLFDVYETWYAEEPTGEVRVAYIADLEAAQLKFKDESYYVKEVELYLKTDDYKYAYATIVHAYNRNVSGATLDSYYQELLKRTTLYYKKFWDFHTAGNGYIAAYDGSFWSVYNEQGDSVSGGYKTIGIINNDGAGLYVNDIDTRILDAAGVVRYRLKEDVLEAGYFNEVDGIVPVKLADGWHYVNTKDEIVGSTYDVAGCFAGGNAVASKGGAWYIVDTAGIENALPGIQDVKLDLYKCYNRKGVVSAKSNGKYDLYDSNIESVVASLQADDMDACIDGTYIAFSKGGKWGFVDTAGNVVIEPQFANARSFSNGYAAVCNADGKWGFIDTTGDLVVDYEYFDAMYFNASGTCLVSVTEGSYQLLSFMFK